MKLFERLRNEQENWIRFELGLEALDDEAYDKEVYHRAHTIVKAMFDENDMILLVAAVHTHIEDRKRTRPQLRRFLKNEKLIYQLKYEMTPYFYVPDDNEVKTHIYSIRMKKAGLLVDKLLRNPTYNCNFYLVNETKQTLLYMYDTRGCDLYGLEKEALRPYYDKFRKWILDYNRIDIDRHFEEGLFNYVETIEERAQREQADEQQVEATKINLYETNTCHITHELIIPIENADACMTEMNQTGFHIEREKELGEAIILTAMKTEALAIVDYQTELMTLYAKKYNGDYKGWSIVKAF